MPFRAPFVPMLHANPSAPRPQVPTSDQFPDAASYRNALNAAWSEWSAFYQSTTDPNLLAIFSRISYEILTGIFSPMTNDFRVAIADMDGKYPDGKSISMRYPHLRRILLANQWAAQNGTLPYLG